MYSSINQISNHDRLAFTTVTPPPVAVISIEVPGSRIKIWFELVSAIDANPDAHSSVFIRVPLALDVGAVLQTEILEFVLDNL